MKALSWSFGSPHVIWLKKDRFLINKDTSKLKFLPYLAVSMLIRIQRQLVVFKIQRPSFREKIPWQVFKCHPVLKKKNDCKSLYAVLFLCTLAWLLVMLQEPIQGGVHCYTRYPQINVSTRPIKIIDNITISSLVSFRSDTPLANFWIRPLKLCKMFRSVEYTINVIQHEIKCLPHWYLYVCHQSPATLSCRL